MISGKLFWDMYKIELERQGFPFRIFPEKGYGWAIINGDKNFSDPNLSVSLVKSDLRIETHIVVMNKKDLYIYERAFNNKDKIEKDFGEPLLWRKGVKGIYTRKIEKNIFYDDFSSTNEIIRQNIEIVKRFIKVFKIDLNGNICI